MHMNLAVMVKLYKHCLEAGKSLKPDIAKDIIGEIYVPTEPNEILQWDFWGPVNYVKRSRKNGFMTVDVFSHWPSDSVCSSNNSRKVLSFQKKYIATNKNPRNFHIEQISQFFSNKIQNFCEKEKLELLKSPFETTGNWYCRKYNGFSTKKFVITCLNERGEQRFEPLLL